jgi:hypothetical protein
MADDFAATPLPASQSNTAWWQRTSFLALLLFAAVLLNNSELVFKTHYYEADDFAANSLQVLKAKQFHETAGNYCRFGFHHPGPAFFYLMAWGEIAFHDVAPIVPTPFNGQLIALYALSAFFLGATVGLIAAKLNRLAAGLFVGLSLLFAAWHFGAVSKFFEFIPGYLGFLTPWLPCLIVLPFLCFVVAAGSVAGGAGKDLPIMTLAGCFLVHGHVAMPLFVVPLTLVAYGGLWREIGRTGARPWNVFRRQHWIAAGTIALFLAPIVVDLLASEPNNLALIVRHLRTTYGEGKGIVQSLLYFLHFGAYAAIPSNQPIPAFEAYDAATLRSFFLLHWRAYACWLGSIFLFVVTTRRTQSVPEGITKFRRRLCVALIIATGSSVIWGCVQEGPMFDYNALFIFAIYYAWLLVVALSIALWVAERCRPRVQLVGVIALMLAVSAAFAHERRRFRGAANNDAQRQFAASVERALKLDLAQPKFLNFDSEANGQAERVALFLERRGVRWWVREEWPLVFGEERIIRPGKASQPVPTLDSSFWRVALRSNRAETADDPNAALLPLTPAVDLVVHRGK